MVRIACMCLLLLGGVAACGGGGGDGPIGSVDQSIRPCHEGRAAFDVWRADFSPNGRQRISAAVDTLRGGTAAEFRLVVACQGEIVAEATDGIACSDPVPPRDPGDSPECAAVDIDVADIPNNQRIECLVEVGTTQPLRIGEGNCVDPAVADYRLLMKIDTASLALDLVADDCRATSSCLREMFGID